MRLGFSFSNPPMLCGFLINIHGLRPCYPVTAIEINGTAVSCYERAFDDLTGERLLNLECEILRHYETVYFKQLWNPLKLSLSSGDKMPRRFQCLSIFGSCSHSHMNFVFAKVTRPNSIACENIILIKPVHLFCNFALKETTQLILAVLHLENTSFISSN